MRKYLLLLLPLMLLFWSCSDRLPERLNFIVVMTDDHGYQAVSCYDSTLTHTPNIDRLASGGVLFTGSFVSNSICAPSRAVMLTGKHSHKNGQLDNATAFDGSQQTFPKLLQEAGYTTAIIGKWHLVSEPTGFNYWNILPGQGHYYNPDFIEMGEERRYEGYVTDIITDKAVDWLREAGSQDKPFCLLVHHKAPHRNWQPDTSLLEAFGERSFPIPETFFDQYDGRVAAQSQKMSVAGDDMDLVYDLKMNDEAGEIATRFSFRSDPTLRMNSRQKEAWDKHYNAIIAEYLADTPREDELALWKYRRYMQDYLACVESVDRNIGRMLDFLRESGLDRNTVVIYTSDQGFYLGEHGWFDKRFMYEESMRTPLIIRLPGEAAGPKRVDHLVQNIDYAPTILDLAGVGIPADMDGISMKALLTGDEDSYRARDALYYHYYEYPNEHMVKRHYGIRTQQYKLIHFYYDIDEWELFDLAEDPHELVNLYNDKRYETVRDSLHLMLDALRGKLNVPGDTVITVR